MEGGNPLKRLKIKSTYVDRFRDRQEDGRYYFYFKQNGTVSGRYGSDAQQLPKPLEEGEDAPIIMKYVNIVRAFLTAGKGRKVIDCDYESLEPHCFASVSGDKKLQEIFDNNYDFYSYVAIQTEKLEGVSADKKADNYLKKLDPVKRNKAKAYSLGVAYGMEAFALKMTLGVEQNVAEELIKGYLDGFPGLAKWRENSRLQVETHGRITNYLGRIRHLPKVQRIQEEHGTYIDKRTNKVKCNILNWRYRNEWQDTTLTQKWHEEMWNKISDGDTWDLECFHEFIGAPKVKESMTPQQINQMYTDAFSRFVRDKAKAEALQTYRDYRNGRNNCLNFQLQSLAAAVVNRAALQINRKAKELGIDAKVQAQVHDQLVVNVDEKDAEMFAPIVQELMEKTTQLPGVTLKAPPEIANNWKDGH